MPQKPPKPVFKLRNSLRRSSLSGGALVALVLGVSCSTGILDFDTAEEVGSVLSCVASPNSALTGQAVTVIADGGLEPYVFSLVSGSGSIDSTSGSLTATTANVVTAQVTDIIGNTATCSAQFGTRIIRLRGGNLIASGAAVFEILSAEGVGVSSVTAIPAGGSLSPLLAVAGVSGTLWKLNLPIPSGNPTWHPLTNHSVEVIASFSDGVSLTQTFDIKLDINRDLNGDGFPDFAIGAPGWSAGKGRVHLYRGSEVGFSAAANQTLDGEDALEFFGEAVALVGDLNGDGLGDLSVGSPGKESGDGEVTIYKGRTLTAGDSLLVDTTMPRTIATGPGITDAAALGAAIAPAGDLDGNGFGDFVIGAPGFGVGLSQNSGAAYIVFGQSDISLAAATILMTDPAGTLASARFAKSLAYAGDVNGDAHPDLVVGARFFSAMPDGKAYVFGGSGNATSGYNFSPLFSVEGTPGSSERLGISLAGGKDINGDGLDDIVVGAMLTTVDGNNAAGTARVLRSRADSAIYSPDILILKAPTFPANAWFGAAVALLPDFTGDGFAEIAVGAPEEMVTVDGANKEHGRVYVWKGATGALNSPQQTLDYGSEDVDVGFGAALLGADWNLDGIGDALVGAPRADDVVTKNSDDSGRAFLRLGSYPFLDTPTRLSPGTTATEIGSRFGASLP